MDAVRQLFAEAMGRFRQPTLVGAAFSPACGCHALASVSRSKCHCIDHSHQAAVKKVSMAVLQASADEHSNLPRGWHLCSQRLEMLAGGSKFATSIPTAYMGAKSSHACGKQALTLKLPPQCHGSDSICSVYMHQNAALEQSLHIPDYLPKMCIAPDAFSLPAHRTCSSGRGVLLFQLNWTCQRLTPVKRALFPHEGLKARSDAATEHSKRCQCVR